MKKIDFSLVRALVNKQRLESIYRYRKGRFDVVGFVLRVALLLAIVALFVVFFGRFVGIYTGVRTNNALNVPERVYELLTVVYSVLILSMTVSGITQINRQIFDADDVRLFSAMPVDATSLYVAKLATIYLSQLVISAVCVLAVNVTLAHNAPQEWQFYLVTALTVFILPLITIALASLLAIPANALKQFLKGRYFLNFLLVTLVLGVMFYLYYIVLTAVQQMLVGNDLRYFFNERVMSVIARVVALLYPSRWLADLLTATNVVVASLCLVATLAICLTLSFVLIRFILGRALQSRNLGPTNYVMKRGKLTDGKSAFFALVKKDFLLIFRTPSYTFSYLSVAVVMPLMVFFCMTVGSSLVDRLVALKVNLELAIFLTLLFGALTNIFCATNVSRDGEMFYAVKAYPLSYKSVFFSKVFLCMLVTLVSQLASAVLLCATGNVNWYQAIFLFFVGALFGFVNICVATRYDFNHARFSTEEDGEIKESGNVVSTVIVLGMLVSFVVGGIVLIARVYTELRQLDCAWITYLVSIASALICAVLAYFYLVGNLGKKYYQFEGGN